MIILHIYVPFTLCLPYPFSVDADVSVGCDLCFVVQRQSSGETKPMSERDRRAQEARARVAARVRNRHSSSPSPPQQVAVAPLAAELIANAPPAVQAPESGVSETGARAEWRQQKAESLEQQNDKAMDVIQRVKAMSASMPVGEEEVSH
jgi:hypothetical protein